MSALPPLREMERAYRERDRSFDGVFFLAVRTTGIFCRPSCPARKPLSANVEFYPTIREALFAGYRPCLRCRPLEADGRPPDWAARLLAEVERRPGERIPDTALRRLGVDPARARRHFLAHYGMTFQAYCRARRLGAALDELRRGADLDEVALGHGFDSHSGFREAFARTFGTPPGRGRGADCILLAFLESPLGPLVAGATPDGVCLLEFTDRRSLETQLETVRRRFGCATLPGSSPHLGQLKSELRAYFAGELQAFTVPVVAPGTPFQEQVWAELRRVPYGETRSYEDLARALGRPSAQRAVGRANGDNRIAVVIPCHRVVNKDGGLGGYGGGLWRKRFLLDLERGVRPLVPPEPER